MASYFSYSVVRSDPTNLTTGGDSILTTLKNVNWEVKKLNSSNNEVPTSIYTDITGNTTISGAGGVTDWNGLIEFWADAGQYVIKVTDPSSRIANKNIYWDSVSGQTGSIPGSTITSESITTAQIKNAEVKTADIDSSAVETANIADAAITNAKIAPSGVTTDKISPGTIAQVNMADGTYVPVGAIMQFAGASAPTNWLLCDGSTKSQSTYAALYAVISTTYNTGSEGSGNFRLPDLRGRVVAGKDDMGGTSAGRLTNTVLTASNTLGATGGAQVHTLSGSQIPAHNHAGTTNNDGSHGHSVTITDPGHRHTFQMTASWANGSGSAAPLANLTEPVNYFYDTLDYGAYGGIFTGKTGISASVPSGGSHQHGFTTNNNTGGDGAHTNTQPTIVLNYIIRAV